MVVSPSRGQPDSPKKSPVKGLKGLLLSVGGGLRIDAQAPAIDQAGGLPFIRKPLQPGLGSRLETQASRAAGHGLRGAAQNAKALFIKLVMDGASGKANAFFRLSGPAQINSHCVLRRVAHGEILKAGGDVLMSLQWQLCDNAPAGRLSAGLACKPCRYARQ